MADHPEPDDDVKDLALHSAGALAALIGAALGVFLPAAGAGGAAAEVVTGFVGRVRQRTERKNVRRLQLIVRSLDERTRDLEARDYSEEEEDLFLSVVKAALEDDEAGKEPFYTGVLVWIIEEKPPAPRVRILADAIRSLSYLELYCFLAENAGRQTRGIHEGVVSQVVLWSRLRGAGLSQGEARVKAGATEFGQILAKYCEFKDLQEPMPPG